MLATTTNEKLDQAGVKLVLISCQNRHPISDMEEAASRPESGKLDDAACHCNIASVATGGKLAKCGNIRSGQGGSHRRSGQYATGLIICWAIRHHYGATASCPAWSRSHSLYCCNIRTLCLASPHLPLSYLSPSLLEIIPNFL